MSAPENERPVDRAIREAAERGEFDNLASAGKPLTGLDAGEDWWLKQYAEREGVLGSEFLPEALRIRKDAETLVARYLQQRSEIVLRREVDNLNVRIRNEIRTPTSELPMFMALLDADAIVEQWHTARAALLPPPPTPLAEPVKAKRWWQRRNSGQSEVRDTSSS